MNVLSLFDGMSCGQIALNIADIPYNNYFASEIDTGAMKLSKHNFPNTKYVGSITNLNYSNNTLFSDNSSIFTGNIDLLMGGSPCQGFSVNGKRLNFDDPRSKLFFEFKRLIDEVNPSKWVFENVASMNRDIKLLIDEYLGTEGVLIDSGDVSAQNRKRYYWANFPFIINKNDSLTVNDILETDYNTKLIWTSERIAMQDFSKAGKRCINPYNKNGKLTHQTDRIYISEEKYTTLRAQSGNRNNIYDTNDIVTKKTSQQDRIYKSDAKFTTLTAMLGNRFNIQDRSGVIRRLSIREQARLQTIPDSYNFDVVSEHVASKCIGNGWTVEVIKQILKCGFVK